MLYYKINRFIPTPVLSLIKTSLVMFEMNFDDRLFKASDGGINYYPVTFIIFILTGYVMTVFVINLLIGKIKQKKKRFKIKSILFCFKVWLLVKFQH